MRAQAMNWLVLLAPSALGCAALVEFPDDPQLVTELAPAQPGDPSGADWTCLGSTQAPGAPAAALAHVRILACDALQGCAIPLVGLRGRVCGKLDVDCTNPLFTGVTDAGGALEFDVPTGRAGFDGYLELVSPSVPCNDSGSLGPASAQLCGLLPGCDERAPDERCQIAPYVRTLQFFNPPIAASLPQPLTLTIISSPALLALVRASGSDFDPGSGHVFVTARDCAGAPAAGVAYDMRQGAGQVVKMYMESGVLTRARSETDGTGMGGFSFVPPGFVDIAAYNSAGTRVGSVGVVAAPFTLTSTVLAPPGAFAD
ncbi:MAG TPA: hypothetical protein VFS67_08490 [Polyangiaceae bacterium]|jgi:hypothetical protein|nr:hypothetical protein [Polyangiaceae bacterium]